MVARAVLVVLVYEGGPMLGHDLDLIVLELVPGAAERKQELVIIK